jgi:DNA polymerase-4
MVEPGREQAFLDPLPVELMWGVGPVTRARLAAAGIRTIGELAATAGPGLEHLLGRAAGAKLGALAADIDPRRIETGRWASSVGAQSAFAPSEPAPPMVRSTLGYLADRVAARMRAAGTAGRTITVRVRFTGLRSVTRSITVPVAISATLTLTEIASELVAGALSDHRSERRITLLAVSVSNLVRAPGLQLELPLGPTEDPRRPGSRAGAARWGADRSVDAVRARFGHDAIGYAAATLSAPRRVPDAFRELAQHDLGGVPTDRARP